MSHTNHVSPEAKRVAAWRKKASLNGLRRLEIAVPAVDGPLMRRAAATLREGGKAAKKLRTTLQQTVKKSKTETGEDLVAFFRNSPLAELDLERDRSTSRPIDLS